MDVCLLLAEVPNRAEFSLPLCVTIYGCPEYRNCHIRYVIAISKMLLRIDSCTNRKMTK